MPKCGVDLSLVAGIVLSIVALWALLLLIFWLLRPKDVPVRELLRIIPDTLRLIRGLIADGFTPFDVRVVLVGLLIWIISPIDLIPEFIPGLGQLDDVIVAVVAMRYVRRRMGIELLQARWSGSANGFALLTRVVGSN